MPPAKAGVPKIEVKFDIGSDGILKAQAINTAEKMSNEMTIVADKGRLSVDEINLMVTEAETKGE